MKINVFGQRIRIELLMMILLIGGFIGVTFWCNCNGNIYEGFSHLPLPMPTLPIPSFPISLPVPPFPMPTLPFAELDDENDRINCGCVNKNDRQTIGNAPPGSEFSM